MEYLSKEHKWANRSIPITRDGTVIPMDRPSYISYMNGSDFHAAIFNNSIPYTSYYINKEEVTSSFINRGDKIPNTIITYEDGCEHTWDFMMKDHELYTPANMLTPSLFLTIKGK